MVLSGLLATAALTACVVASLATLKPEVPPPLPAPTTSGPSPDFPRTAPPIPRTAKLDILVRAGEHDVEQVETYELVVGVNDPLLAWLRQDGGAGAEIGRFVLASSYPYTRQVTIEQAPGSDTATIRFYSVRRPQFSEISSSPWRVAEVAPVEFPTQDSTVLSPLVSELQIVIRVEDFVITQVADATPTSQSASGGRFRRTAKGNQGYRGSEVVGSRRSVLG